jgi:predicted MFS family arabinose efflux permease
MGSALSSLRIPGFARLAGSYTLNELGDNIGVVALAILVLDRTGYVMAPVALFISARLLPALLAPIFTARLDRLALRRVLPPLYLGEALAFGLLALTTRHFWLPVVLVLALADGAIAVTARGLTRGAVASLLIPAGLLREGNAAMNVGFAAASAAGPALGGLIVAGWGPGVALLIDAVSFLLVAFVLVGHRHEPSEDGSELTWRERVREGVQAVSSRPLLKRLVIAEAAGFVLFTIATPIEIVYVKRTLDAGDVAYGVLLSAWGIGILAGSGLFARLRHRELSTILAASTVGVGLAFLGFAAANSVVVACAAAFVGGLGNGVQWVAFLTLIQEEVAEGLQARVMGLLESMGAAMPGLGFIAGGAMAAIWDPRVAFAVAGVGGLCLAVAFVLAQAAEA